MHRRSSVAISGEDSHQEIIDPTTPVQMVGFFKTESQLNFVKNYKQPDEESVQTRDSEDTQSPCLRPPKSFFRIFYKYASRASLNGVIFILHSKKPVVKLAWVALLLAAIGATLFHLYYLFSIFFEYQKYSKVSLKFNSLQFPAVTFCNMNMMRMSQISNASKEIQILFSNDIKGPTNASSPYSNTSDADPQSEPNTYDASLLEWVQQKETALCEHCDYCWEQGEFENSSLYEVDDYFMYIYNKQSLDQRKLLGHQLDGMLRMCSFAERPCSSKLFLPNLSAKYGNCYTLEGKDFISHKSGPTGGLELILSVERDEYMPIISSSVGARVIIHERRTPPFQDQNDLAISPGMHTMISLKQVQIRRIGVPYSPCEPDTTSAQTNEYRYTTSVCQKQCEQAYIIAMCNCYDSDLTLDGIDNTTGQCINKPDRQCMYKRRCEIEKDDNACRCNSPCGETIYEKTIATIPWPTDSFVNAIYPEICNGRTQPSFCNQMNASTDVLKQELFKLSIYFEDLNYEELVDQPNYEFTNLLSDIGGSIGLWIGLSVLSLFEIVHLLVELIRYLTCRRWTKTEAKGPGRSEQSVQVPEANEEDVSLET
ncbi:unnamed protein product [Lymnaea stagnalis]|uniref:Uncharacterized protein n=1 Tax=Lymnaea stagnalis TaxID=6523 RepID=A0AAV2I1X0_LYMST